MKAIQRRRLGSIFQLNCNRLRWTAWHGILKTIHDEQRRLEALTKVSNALPEDYRQMLSYLHDDYGRLGFIITRDRKMELYTGPELDWTREMFNKHRTIIIKLTGTFLYSLLSKLGSSHKLDPCDVAINKLLDTYTRLYLSGAKIMHQPPVQI